jgi:hypothetical protein
MMLKRESPYRSRGSKEKGYDEVSHHPGYSVDDKPGSFLNRVPEGGAILPYPYSLN